MLKWQRVGLGLAVWCAVASASVAQPLVGSAHTHTVGPAETANVIAAAHAMSVEHLKALNDGQMNGRLQPGLAVRVDDRHVVPGGPRHGVVINVPQRMLFLFEQERVLLAFPIAAGHARTPTPRGLFHVVEREIDPVWDVPRSIRQELLARGLPAPTRVPPGRGNPLGDRWLGLDAFDIGIHGTNAPASIYRLVTHGCIRLHPDHVRALFERVPLGTEVTVLYQPVLSAAYEGELWLEVHPDAYGLVEQPHLMAIAQLSAYGLAMDVETRRKVKRVVERQSGRPERVATRPTAAAGGTP